MNKNNGLSKRIAMAGIFASLAIVFGYVEMMIPINLGIPGAKLGIANLVTVSGFCLLDKRDVWYISIIRIVLTGLLFGSLASMIYSMAGGILSLVVMMILIKIKIFSIIGVSIAGGISHNIGQLAVATYIIKNMSLAYYLPFLLVVGMITGLVIGIMSKIISDRIEKLLI